MNVPKLLRSVGWVAVLAVVVVAGAVVSDVQAMPNFARQYGFDCTACHTIVPRLNKTGYQFRRAGFRDPGEIGQKRDFEKDRQTPGHIMSNYFSARLQGNISWVNRDHALDDGSYYEFGGSYNQTNIEFKEFTLYPMTGGFLGNWAAESEISGSTDEIEVENAYVRYVAGDEHLFWEARFGIFHPFEGYGASDRPLSLSRPLIQTMGTVNGLGDSNGWHPWGFDQTGIEGGVTINNTSVSLMVFNGLIENADDPAQGGKLKKAPGSPTDNDKDFQLFFHQFIGDTGAAISASYYDGSISLGPGVLYANDFTRAIVYGTVPIGKVMLLAAYSTGDNKDALTHTTVDNSGWFFEVDSYLTDTLGIGARYDSFDPSDDLDNNDVTAFSLFVNMPLNNGLQWIAEYKNKTTEKGVDTEMGVNFPDQTEDSINIRAIYIW